MNPSKMILNCIEYLQDFKDSNCYDAYIKLIGFVANRANVTNACTETMHIEEYTFLEKNFNLSLLYGSPTDYFTPVLEKLSLIDKLSPSVLKKAILQLNEFKVDSIDAAPLIHLIMPQQTSKFLILAYNKFKENAIYAVAEPDILQYRIALLNTKLFNIPSLILNIDPFVYDISLSSPNWNYVNFWDGAPIDKLITIKEDSSIKECPICKHIMNKESSLSDDNQIIINRFICCKCKYLEEERVIDEYIHD